MSCTIGLCKKTWNDNLKELVTEIITLRRPDKYVTIIFPIIPVLYVILSQIVSGLNFCAFDLLEDDVIIQWSQKWKISGSLKISLIAVSFLGFIIFDLLYTQLIMRYAYQCQMNIYFLEIILYNVKKKNYRDQKRAIEDVVKAQKFLNQLNKNSIATGLAMLITSLQATNCTIALLSVNNKALQTTALALRLMLWVFLTLFPIFMAAKANNISDNLRDTGLIMYRSPKTFDNNELREWYMHAAPITLRAKLFGIPMHPWFPYVLVVLILFTLMVGSGFKWYEHLF